MNFFEEIPENLEEELFTEVLAKDGVRVERIVSEGHVSAEGFWYDQSEHEWIFLLKGSARLALETEAGLKSVLLGVGDTLFIPARARHRVEETAKDEQTIWLAVFWLPEKEGGA